MKWEKLLDDTAQQQPVPRSPLVFLIGYIVAPLTRWYFRIRVRGKENLPPKGQPVLFAMNHQSYLDPLVFSSSLPLYASRSTWYIAKDKHFDTPFRRWFARTAQVMLISENIRLRQAIPSMASILKQNRNLAIFPEGTRSRSGKPGEFKKTFAILSTGTGFPVVPVAIDGTFKAAAVGKKFPRRVPVRITILPPVYPDQLDTGTLAREVEDAVCSVLQNSTNAASF